MKIQRKEKRKFLILLITLLIIAIISFFNKSFAMKHYQEVDFTTGLVTASTLNVRQGPGLSYKVISKVHKNEYIRAFARIDNWYVVQTDKDIIGAVYVDYIKPIYNKTQETSIEIEEVNQIDNKIEQIQETSAKPIKEIEQIGKEEENLDISVNKVEYSSELTKDEQDVLNSINNKRKQQGLEPLMIDDDLQNICRIKAKDMVENGYFEHNSPTYGTPFEMLKENGISYKVAGENIAGNIDNDKAIESWMNSENHRANIINSNYNYTGVAVVKSSKYGKIFVQMFIGR